MRPSPATLALSLALAASVAFSVGRLAAAPATVPVAQCAPAPVNRIALDYTETTDLWPYAPIVKQAWSTLLPSKSFTVESATSTVDLDLAIGANLRTGTDGHSWFLMRFNVDNGARVYPVSAAILVLQAASASGGDVTALTGGRATLTDLAPGPHTIRLDYFSVYNGLLALRAASLAGRSDVGAATEFLRLQVIEHP